MRHITCLMFCAAFLPPIWGCGVHGTPEFDQERAALVEIAADEIPAGLELCTDLYGAVSSWPKVDAIYGVRWEPDAMILQVHGQLTCHAPRWEAAKRADLARLAGIGSTHGVDRHHLMSDGLPPPPGAAALISSGEREDSNPLPASPNPEDSVEDSNPLPARDGRWSDRSDSTDSNPLPAHEAANPNLVEWKGI